ncbi:MAG: serine/threonine-protein kinase [Planctomycetota bacterium]
MSTKLECPSCRTRFAVEEAPPSGICNCERCGRAILLGHSRLSEAADGTLRDILLEEGLVTRAQIDEASKTLTVAREKGKALTLSEVLVARNFVTHAQIERVLDEAGAPGAVAIPGYEILEELGKGGMGTVYKGIHTASGKAVAIKVLAPRLARQKDFLKRFHREARVAIELDHPNIVKGFDEGAVGRTHYFVMEFVEGKGAERVLKKRKRFGERRAMDIARQTARAVQYAHERGMVHRDIKPDNIILTRGGGVKLADYGLVKLADDASTLGLTASGQIMGTPHYLSPEQAAGERDIDIRSDIYSLGATLYHMLAGTTPYTGKGSAEIMSMHIYGKLEDPRKWNDEITEAAANLVLRMMARAREDRYQTPARLLAAFDEYFSAAGSKGTEALERELLEEQAADSAVRSRIDAPGLLRSALAFGGAAVCAGLVAGLVWLLTAGRPAPADTTPLAVAAERTAQERELAEARATTNPTAQRTALAVLAETYPDSDVAWRARADALAAPEAAGTDGEPERLAAAAALALRMETLSHPAAREAVQHRLAETYGDTPIGRQSAAILARREDHREAEERRRLEVDRRRREEERRRQEQEARENAATQAYEVVALLKETPDVYEQRLEEFLAAPDYQGTAAHDRADQALQQFRKQQAARERAEQNRQRAEAARKATEALHRESVKALARGRAEDFAAAVTTFLETPEFAPFRTQAAPYQRDLERLGKFNESLEDGLRKYVNTTVRVKMDRGGTLVGTLSRVGDGSFVLVTKSGKDIERQIRGIQREHKISLARAGFDGESWEAAIMCGLYRLVGGDLDGAAAEFNAAHRDPDRKHHQAILQGVRTYLDNL